MLPGGGARPILKTESVSGAFDENEIFSVGDAMPAGVEAGGGCF